MNEISIKQMEFGAGDRGRTGDVRLANFVLNLMFSCFVVQVSRYILPNFFLSPAISTDFTRSTFVLGTFWERGSTNVVIATSVSINQRLSNLILQEP